MQRRRLGTTGFFGLIAVGLCLFAAGPAQAASSNGPYYAEPAWDQKLAAATRFVVLTDWASAAVLDRETGLVWEKSPLTSVYPWDFSAGFLALARGQCANRTTDGREGWRLPSLPQLASLVDPSVAFPGPTLPVGHPFTNVQSTFYWSATTVAGDPTVAYGVFFDDGLVTLGKPVDNHAWCVRGGMNADA